MPRHETCRLADCQSFVTNCYFSSYSLRKFHKKNKNMFVLHSEWIVFTQTTLAPMTEVKTYGMISQS